MLGAAPIYFERGYRYVTARFAGLTVEEFDELRVRAGVMCAT